MTKEQVSPVDILVSDISTKFGKGSIFSTKDNPLPDVEFITTSSPNLNWVLGGGIGRGRIVEIFGDASCGKTTTCANIIASIHQENPDTYCSFIDVEHSIDPKYFQNIGIDMNRLLISQPDYAEQALEILDMMVRSGALPVIVLDSVAGLVPLAELEGEMDSQQVGLQARLMGKALRKLTALANKTGTTIIFTNQTRQDIGPMAHGRKVSTGGRALLFFASQRLELKRIGDYKIGDEIVGTKVKAVAKKNKLAPPFREKEIIISFGKGINTEIEIIETGLRYKIFERKGPYVNFNGENIACGVVKTAEVLETNKELRQQILQAISEKEK